MVERPKPKIEFVGAPGAIPDVVDDVVLRTAWGQMVSVSERMQYLGCNRAVVGVINDGPGVEYWNLSRVGEVGISYVFLTESTPLAKNGYYVQMDHEVYHRDAIHWLKVIRPRRTVEEIEADETKRLAAYATK